MKYRVVVDIDVPSSLDPSKTKDLFTANYPMRVVAIIPDIKNMPRGCRGCTFFLNVFDRGNTVGRVACNHPENLQRKIGSFHRQKVLSQGWFPNPPAWCKKEENQ